ncbi:MAG TPA: hypothetical protein VFR48_11105, partial [Solirubrobacteraceae bacterium]|nr:hypothetical protein [Solirubrobacteraceae bacterium]
SSEPEIANFVEQDPNSSNLRKPLQDSSGHVIPDSHSGILCAFNAGTTTVTISAGGLSYSTQVTVLGGSVEQPCGTVPLSASHFKTQAQESAAAPSSPPPSPAPAPAPIAPPPPPPPAPAAKAPAPKPAPKVALPLAIPPIVKLPSTGPVPVVPPPPAAGFADPIPPGGATVRVFEEKREEEAAPESSQAFARAPLHPDRARSFTSTTHVMRARPPAYAFAGAGANVNKASSSIPLYLLALVLFMAAGGATIRIGPGRRRRAAPASLSLADDHFNQRPRRRR